MNPPELPPPACNVCHATSFVPKLPPQGPQDGRSRRCLRCAATDRDRMLHELYQHLHPLASKWRAVHFAPEGSIANRWFGQNTAFGPGTAAATSESLAAGGYDIALAGNALEQVGDDSAVIRELLRLVGASGLVQVAVTGPLSQWATEEWGHADPARRSSFRRYGCDFASRIGNAFPDLHGLAVFAADPVTRSSDVIAFFSYADATLAEVADLLRRRAMTHIRLLPAWTSFAAPRRPVARPRTRTVGLQRRDYAEQRNITALNRDRVKFVDLESDFASVRASLRDWMQRTPMMRTNAVCPVPDPSIDCYHFFNTLPLNGVPFVCTFETALPRWAGVDLATWEVGLDILAAPNCRRLFAISDSAVEYMRRGLWRFGASLTTRIMDKVELLYPPQPLPGGGVSEAKFARRELDLAFVGRDLLRKGGYEVLLAVESLLERGLPLRLTLVSSLQPAPDGEHFPWNADAERKLARCAAIVARFPTQIVYHPSLPNEAVLALFADAHISLLPSFLETFGYSVLEAQSRRCPVVTTRQRAFPEINSEVVGWLLGPDFDGNDLATDGGQGFADLSATLTDQLTRLLADLAMRGPASLRERAEEAVRRVWLFHHPSVAADTVFAYY